MSTYAQSPLVTQSLPQDAGVQELIEALDARMDDCWDQERKRHRIELLSKKEYDAAIAELSKCQDDFSYASRNYFKIVTKKGIDISLRLNESQDLVLEVMRKIQAKGKSQRIAIIKARQLGMSTLIEALIAWRTMFFPNARAIVVSDNADNAADLFGKMLHIYDHMPWWLKPMIDRRKEDKGLKFDNPDEGLRGKEPGLQSSVSVQAATQITGVGQGRSINSAHLSEWADWQEDKAIEIIQEDIGNALAEDPYTFAFLESTAKGAGTFAHKLWRRQVAMAEMAEWYPLFIPWFFDREHFVAPSKGWRPDQTGRDLKDRIKRDWVRCTRCGSYREIAHNGESLVGVTCWHCNAGTFEPVVLTDGQLYWRHNKAANSSMDAKTKKTFLQEQPSTSEEAFQVSGYTVFPLECIEYVATTIDKRLQENGGAMIGHFDEKGRYHAMIGRKRRRCRVPGCAFDHAYDPNHLKVWEEPVENAQYVVGADVSEGLGGDADYSVAWVNRIGGFGGVDTHVATFRCNEIGPIEFGDVLNFLGRWYNEALMSVEVNKYDSCFTQVRQYHMYPNNFRWKHVDATNMQSNKWGWWTTLTTKPRLYQTGSMWLRKRQWVIRDEEFYEEMLTFQKLDPEDRAVGSEAGFHDDVVMAALIALYTSHDLDWDENLQYVPTPNSKGGIVAGDQWAMSCGKCGFRWSATSPDSYKRCPNDKAGPGGNLACRSIQITGQFVANAETNNSIDIDKELNYAGERSDPGYIPSYEEL